MKIFSENRPLIENEFENANYDKNSGLDAKVIAEKLKEIQNTPTDEPRESVCAKAFAYVLENVQLEINENTPFSLKFNAGIDYSYFSTPSVFERELFPPQRDKILRENFPDDYKKMLDNFSVGVGFSLTDFWHTVPDWTYLTEHGFPGILKNAEASKARLLESKNYEDKQIIFLDSVIVCYEAILKFLERVYNYSLKFNVPEFSECIKNLSENPPQTLYEIMQFSILYLYFEELGIERARTLGPIDKLYYPFYKKALENGRTEQEIKELFQYYFMHFTAAKRYAEQPFTICGKDKDGNDFSNELSYLILDYYDELNIYDPKIHIRYHENLPDKILSKALSMIRDGNSSICLINDDTVFAAYEKLGIPKTDSQNYVILGCYEPIIPGLEEGEIAPDRFNMVKCIEFAINGGKDILTGKQISFESPENIETFEEFFDVFLKHLDSLLDFDLYFAEKQGFLSTEINPSPIYSSSFSACIEKGADVHSYPLKYNNLSLKPFGLATVVDSLVAMKKFVFDSKIISFEEMKTALKNDWKGYEDLQRKISNDTEKYGNNLNFPDELTVKITKHLEERYCGKKLERGGVLRLGLDSVYHCVVNGEKTAATPDGRNAKTPTSKNLCASDGKDKGGITAYMQSALRIDSTAFADATVLDFILHPTAVEGERGLEAFKTLIKIYFRNGGFAAQGNIVKGETLKDAQLHPEKYSTLQVRVCGWNEYFVKLSKVKQDMFIKQCEVSG